MSEGIYRALRKKNEDVGIMTREALEREFRTLRKENEALRAKCAAMEQGLSKVRLFAVGAEPDSPLSSLCRTDFGKEAQKLLDRLKALERLYQAAGICKGQLDPSEYGEEEVKEFDEALASCEKFSRNESS